MKLKLDLIWNESDRNPALARAVALARFNPSAKQSAAR
jgi:hypothetical protein